MIYCGSRLVPAHRVLPKSSSFYAAVKSGGGKVRLKAIAIHLTPEKCLKPLICRGTYTETLDFS